MGMSRRPHLVMFWSLLASLCCMTSIMFAADRVVTKKPRNSTITIQAPANMTPARAKRTAATVWPELTQIEVDDVTARAKAIGKETLRIFCFDEVKCGDLTSSLENAFESAHWTVVVKYINTGMIPEGMEASPKALKALATIDPGFSRMKMEDPEPGETITIGAKPQGRLE